MIGNKKVYNEFSLQFELALWLRDKGFDVYFEKNINTLISNKSIEVYSIKKEIDLSIKKDNKWIAFIELKFPIHGKVPETVFDIVKDLELLNNIHCMFNNQGEGDSLSFYQLTVTNDVKFFSNKKNEKRNNPRTSKYYSILRDKNPIEGDFTKPTGDNVYTIPENHLSIFINKKIEWNNLAESYKFFILTN